MMDSLLSWFLAVFICLFLTTSSYSQSITNPSQGQIEYVQIKYKQKTATLNCPIRADNQLVMKWLKEGTVIDLESEDHNKQYDIETTEQGSRLIIKSAFENGYGNYTCQLFNQKNFTMVDTMSKNFVVISELTLKMEEFATVIEGAELKLKCLVTSRTPPFQMKWRFGNETYETSRDRVTLMPDDKGIPNALLKVDAVVMADRGTFTCMGFATPVANATEIETYVRVKDKYAALWPFLGICAEVLILCTIILIYEKKRNKAELEESDTDQSPDQKNTPDMGKDSVRQRK